MVREEKLTMLLATPTFLLSYMRKATAEDFSSLRSVIVGAEKLRQKTADAFEKKFGYKPTQIRVAIDALVVFVHKDNPCKGMNLQQLDSVFSTKWTIASRSSPRFASRLTGLKLSTSSLKVTSNFTRLDELIGPDFREIDTVGGIVSTVTVSGAAAWLPFP